ncbi:MAG TPA: phytanoyl-CoA dioxygenase family protein [Reyranella sp.]
MTFTDVHWADLARQGYTIVSGVIDEAHLRATQDAANELNALYPEGGWDLRKKDLWRQVYACEEPRIVALVADILDPLALEIVDTVATPDRIQLASTLSGFSTPRETPRFLHIDGGKGPSLAAFNFLFGVALTPVASDSAGGFHVLPGSHDRFSALFSRQPTDQPVHWGELKITGQNKLRAEARMVVPRLQPGDIIVCHSFLAHGTSSNTSDVRRDMIFQRRASVPLADPATRMDARAAFMRDHWTGFKRRP